MLGAGVDPLEVWGSRLPQVIGGPIDGGHFLVEERPAEVPARVLPHLAAATG